VSVTVAQLYQRYHLEFLFSEKVEYAFFAQSRFMPGVARTLGAMAKSQLCISLIQR
jgi:hypothetical protein